MSASKLLPIALALLLTACTATQINRQSNITLPEHFQHTGQSNPAPGPDRWWRQWPDHQLARLIEQGLQHNHSIALAQSRLEEARATARLAEADLLPSAGLAANAYGYRNHRRDPYLGNGGHLASASFSAAWEPDIFGQKSSDADAARAAALGAQEQLHGSRLLISAQIAEHYLRAAHIQQQQTLIAQQLATLRELSRYIAGRFQAGHATAHDTGAIAAQIQALEARQSTLAAQFDAQQRSIAVLIGQTPQSFRLDSEAMRRAAEIQARSAQLASAKADLLPRFNIQFLWQTGRIELNSDLAPLNRARSGNGGLLSIGVQLPLFTAGRIRANIQAADARLQSALIQYDQTLLQALADVDNAYQAQHALAAQQQQLQQAERTARQQVRNDQQLFRYGRKTLDTPLQSRLTAADYSQHLLDNQLAAGLNLLNLYKAIGSGWQQEGSQPAAAESAARP
ncbi:TolC family protein [Eikenella sp. Marseille-P7795]|uniref:TolC family protein n=1 Tax=Eikenella sp. Marseille-P7795 TaxID=2866577 RepID=UPI001CE48B29|nr:TolC family protein [Eikenella sp. Marseille-P7795]